MAKDDPNFVCTIIEVHPSEISTKKKMNQEEPATGSKVTHVIFDMDGLILDTETLYDKAIGGVLERYGHKYPFELKLKGMGRTGNEGAKILINEVNLPLTVEEYGKIIDEAYVKVFSGHVPLMPGAEKLIRHLHAKKVPIAVATSSKGSSFKLKTQNHKELFSLFDHIVIASDDPEVTRGKPDPQTFLVCASRFKCPPKSMSDVLVFEDSPAGVQAANAADMKSVWVPDPRCPRDVVQAKLVLNSLEEFRPEQFGLPPYSQC